MDRTISARLQETFGVPDLGGGLLHAFPFALRFALAEDKRGYGPRFLKAMSRAGAVLDHLFADSRQVSVIVREFVDPQQASGEPGADQELAELGFQGRFGAPEMLRPATEDEAFSEAGQIIVHVLREAVIAPDETEFAVLLWTPMARDMGVRPIASGLIDLYLIDFERRVAVYPYDDRGMDIVAADGSVLGPLTERFADWVSDRRLGD